MHTLTPMTLDKLEQLSSNWWEISWEKDIQCLQTIFTFKAENIHLGDCKGNPKDIVKKKLKRGKENLCGSGRINATSWPFLTKSQCWVNDPSTQTNVGAHVCLGTGMGSSTKPNIVHDYNNGMSRVDQSDQMLSYYQGLRSVFNGTRRLEFIFLIYSFNSFYLTKQQCPGSLKILLFKYRTTAVKSL